MKFFYKFLDSKDPQYMIKAFFLRLFFLRQDKGVLLLFLTGDKLKLIISHKTT